MPKNPFLGDLTSRPVQAAISNSWSQARFCLGQGNPALEVVFAEAASAPSREAMRTAWKARSNRRAVPVLLAVLYGNDAAVAGLGGDPEYILTDVDRSQLEGVCRAALALPDQHAARHFLNQALADLEGGSTGWRNMGLFATHFLRTGVPKLASWREACQRGAAAKLLRKRDLLESIGLSVDAASGSALILRAGDARVALALLLEGTERPEVAQSRFNRLSPVSYALAKAESEGLRYVVLLSTHFIRLYPVETGVGTGQRGRSETYFEVDLNLLAPDQAGYLWLLFSAEALRRGGMAEQVLGDSRRYAADLGERLRDRVYTEVVPRLAEGLMEARSLRRPTAANLTETYEMALVILFRLLFIAYAEDQDLLPYSTNQFYRDRSLKKKAQDFTVMLRSGHARGGEGSDHWDEVKRLFRAVDKGNSEWGVPAYNGGLFASDGTSSIGGLIASVELADHVFVPVLEALLVDRTDDGWGPVDFRSLGVREFGTIYEGLLENELSLAETDLATDKEGNYRPAKPRDTVIVERGRAFLHNTSGQRKSTGSYFTKHFAVEHLLEHSLEPALKTHLERLDSLNERQAAQSFFDFRVADITMGSAHFLVAAIDRIERALLSYLARRPLPEVGDELGRLRQAALCALGSGASQLQIEDGQLLRRQIARRCIYGVDVTETAVELARLAVWIHTFVPGLPLSFLNRTLVQGNSIVGIGSLAEARDCIRELLNQPLFDFSGQALIGQAAEPIRVLAGLSDANASEVEQARAAFDLARAAARPAAALFDVLTASRIHPEIAESLLAEAMEWNLQSTSPISSELHSRSVEKLSPIMPFHFPVEFPEVFLRDRSGFDVIVGNPPWEKVRVEEHEFWARHVPGLRGVGKAERDRTIAHMRSTRSDLVRAWQKERAESESLREAVRFLPGMNTGHPDLFRAFTIRFIELSVSSGGFVAVVLPGDAFKIAGASDVRERLAHSCSKVHVQMFTNKGNWVFESVDPRKLISLVIATRRSASLDREPESNVIFEIPPEFHSFDAWQARISGDSTLVSLDVLRQYSASLVLPLMPCSASMEVILQLMKSPKLENHPALAQRRVYADFETSKKDKAYWHDDRGEGDIPVYAGESFDIWAPDTGAYYAYTESATIEEAAYAKWNRVNRSSPYSAIPQFFRRKRENHPMYGPRIAFRDVTNRTNTRTLVVSLIPPLVVTVQTAPWVLWTDMNHPKWHEAYLLGVLSSLPCDWWCRRFIEQHADQEAFNCIRVPNPAINSSASARVVELAGRLASPDERFAEWASAVDVGFGPIDSQEKQKDVHELDAITAHLYGLTEAHLRHIFETFHEGWDYRDRLEATLEHYRRWQTQR